MILVSVVIPVFNSAENLRNCLSNLKLVVNGEIEVVVIDDGSTDQSPFVATSFSEEFENFKFQRLSQNRGIGNARNLGINLSLGIYIYFLDCDDTVSGNFSNALKLLNESIKARGKKDKSANMIIERCETYIINPPSENWDGVYTRTHK